MSLLNRIRTLLRLPDSFLGQTLPPWNQIEGTIVRGRILARGDLCTTVQLSDSILGVMHAQEQPRGDRYDLDDFVSAVALYVPPPQSAAHIVMSRSHPSFVVALFAACVPEIRAGTVQIKAVGRIAGVKTKIAVSSTDTSIDPVAACVGRRAGRVQGVVQELSAHRRRQEHIDIIPWVDDPAEFICRAMSPASVLAVRLDPETGTAEVTVPDDQVSAAQGRGGSNLTSAMHLTGWNLKLRDSRGPVVPESAPTGDNATEGSGSTTPAELESEIKSLEQWFIDNPAPDQRSLDEHCERRIALAMLYLRHTQEDLFHKCLVKAVDAARIVGDRLRLAQELLRVATLYDHFDRLRDSASLLREAYGLANELERDDVLGEIYYRFGSVLEKQGELLEAERLFRRAVAAEGKLGRLDILGDARQRLGCVLYSQGKRENLAEAEENAAEGLRIMEIAGDEEDVAACCGNLGLIYAATGRTTEAEECYRRALAINENLERSVGIAKNLANLGLLCTQTDRREEAVEHFSHALEIARELGDAELETSIRRHYRG